jgi:hypothetical protein
LGLFDRVTRLGDFGRLLLDAFWKWRKICGANFRLLFPQYICINFDNEMGIATFWAILLQTELVTLVVQAFRLQSFKGKLIYKSNEYFLAGTRWPDWLNFRPLGDCKLWSVFKITFRNILASFYSEKFMY